MGVVGAAKRTVQITVAAAVVVYIGFYALTKWDTSEDRQATVIVELAQVDRAVHGNVHTYINGAERSGEVVSKENPKFSETFWVRPGEKVRVTAHLFFGQASLKCQILIDGTPGAGPVQTPVDFEMACDLSATA